MINVFIGFNRPTGDLKLTSVAHSGNIKVSKDFLGNLVVTIKDTKPWTEVRYPMSLITTLTIEGLEVGN